MSNTRALKLGAEGKETVKGGAHIEFVEFRRPANDVKKLTETKLSSIERIFGKQGKSHPILSPKHLLHTLPPDYPLLMAIQFLMQFLEELHKCLASEQANAEYLEIQIAELLPKTARLQKEYSRLKAEQDKANILFKFRFNKQLAGMEAEIAQQNKQLEDLIRAKKAPEEYIETIQNDIVLYELRVEEIMRQYLEEIANIQPHHLAPYLANAEISALHQKITASCGAIS